MAPNKISGRIRRSFVLPGLDFGVARPGVPPGSFVMPPAEPQQSDAGLIDVSSQEPEEKPPEQAPVPVIDVSS